MAQDKPTPTAEYIAPLLGVKVLELQELLTMEFQHIKAHTVERRRYANDLTSFRNMALQQLFDVVSSNEKYVHILRRIIHFEEPRHFYFFSNELDAIERILAYIDKHDSNSLALDSLGLYSLPSLLAKVRNLKVLNISKNKLTDISLIRGLPRLETLIADDNEIKEIGFLEANPKLHTLSLNRNRVRRSYEVLKSMPSLRTVHLVANLINDADVKPILESPYIQDVQLQDNQILAPAEYLTSISKLREFFNIKIPWHAQPKETLNAATESNAPNAADTADEQETVVADELEEASTNGSAIKAAAEKEPEQFVSYAIREIRIYGNPNTNEKLLDIEKLSGIFYDLIAKSDSSGEHFFGLFGRWGRGKTFFWRHILENNLNREKYIPIEFHAWKYQDTPGIWAYLYKTFNNAYLTDDPKKYKFFRWLNRIRKLFKLNRERGKLSAIVMVGLIWAITVAAITWMLGYLVKDTEAFKTTLHIGLPVWVLTMVAYVAKTVKTDVRKVILSVTSKVDVNSQLGFQHEIQQELKHLLKAWLPAPKDVKEEDRRRIFLFIDDIDRCSEEKIIQIVDYIRVLLHDKEIQNRITVLAAIDERILLHAIQDKYKAFVESKDNNATYKELCREYMDKLFLAGLKLGPLTEFEKRQIVEGFTGKDTAKGMTPPVTTNGISAAKVVDSMNKQPEIQQPAAAETNDTKVVTAENGHATKTVATVSTSIPSTAGKEFPYEKWEQEFIKEVLARQREQQEHHTESTPRSIRVYTYRYLFGKQLVEKALQEGKASWKQWYNTQDAKKCFAIQLFHYSFRSDVAQLVADYQQFIAGYDESRLIEVKIYENNISLNQELGSIMFQVLTMIVAY